MDEYVDRFALRDALYDADAITMRGFKIINQFPTAVDAETLRWFLVFDEFNRGGQTLEVICNIHDNPELLEGGDEG